MKTKSLIRSHICGHTCHPGGKNCNGYCQPPYPGRPDHPAKYEVPLFDFGNALHLLKDGKKVAREGWNGKGMWLELQRPDEHSKMTLPYVYLNYPENSANTPGARVPWLASQTDMLADDWMEV